MVRAKKPGDQLYKLKVKLVEAPMPIWRRLVIRAGCRLNLVHHILQITMGWTNSHLYEFKFADRRFGDLATADDDDEVEDSSKFSLDQLLKKPGQKLVYNYDFGDCWEHDIELEEIMPADDIGGVARCLAGKRACPPEDVGGVPGYARFLEIIEDPEHPERKEMLTWIGSEFDPDSFDARQVNLNIYLFEQGGYGLPEEI